jgi:hypothetical protein
MLHQPDPQLDYELVCIEHLVPEEHLLRYIGMYMDFTFIREKVRPFYSETTVVHLLTPLLSKKAPDHSTISWNRKYRFKGTNVF